MSRSHVLLTSIVSVLVVALAAAEQDPRPLHVVICTGPDRAVLVEFERYLESNYHVQCNWVEAMAATDGATGALQGLEHLADADVILSNLQTTAVPAEQLAVLKKHFLRKPVLNLGSDTRKLNDESVRGLLVRAIFSAGQRDQQELRRQTSSK